MLVANERRRKNRAKVYLSFDLGTYFHFIEFQVMTFRNAIQHGRFAVLEKYVMVDYQA